MRSLAVALLVALPSTVWAHGGLPVTQEVLHKGNTLFVPVVFWGVWVQSPGQPWTWICEEAINTNRNRKTTLSTDGTFYTTDVRGITRSTDGGCTWTDVTGDISTRLVNEVVADPSDGATAWAITGDSGMEDADGGMLPPDNALWVTHDHGDTFSRVAGLAAESGRLFQGVRVAGTGATATIYVSSVAPGAVFDPEVHRSDDGGATFTTYPLSYQLDGLTPFSISVMAIDPRDPKVVYLRASASTITDAGEVAKQSLLRSIDGGMTVSELIQLDGVLTPSNQSRGIDGVAIDTTRGQVLVATVKGLYAGADAGDAPSVTLQPTGGLSTAQCVDVSQGTVLACSSDYSPDFAALAQSDDGAKTFHSILKFVDTEGPVSCPAGTPVGDMCPLYWEMYGSQLGISFNDAGMPVGDGGMNPHPSGGCACDLGGPTRGALTGLVVAFALAGLLLLRRRA